MLRSVRAEDRRIDAKVREHDVAHAPFAKQCAERRRGDNRALEAIVEVAHVAAGEIEKVFGDGAAEESLRGANVGLGKVRVVKADDGDAQRDARMNGFPRDLIRITALDEVRFMFEDASVGLRARGNRIFESRVDGVSTRALVADALIAFAGNDEDVLILRRMRAEEARLLADVAFHATAVRQIELREIAELHEFSAAQCSKCARYFSASSAAAQPWPAAVTAWR